MEIKNLADYINKSSERIENNINNQTQRIINSNNPTQEEKMQYKILESMLPVLLNNPEILKNIIK